jgi:flagellar motor switch protein FliG
VQGSTKAASIYKLLGEDLPMEVFQHLSSEEIERLLLKLDKNPKINKSQETSVLKEFINQVKKPLKTFSHSNSELVLDPYEGKLIDEIHQILSEENNGTNSGLEILEKLSAQEISKLINDEPPSIIAQVLYFCPHSTAKDVVNILPAQLREKVILEFGNLDFHSVELRDELGRFLSFKSSLLLSPSRQNLHKVKGRGGKKAAELLSLLNPGESEEIISKIQKKRPEFAENINEHYYSLKDLLLLGRTSLSRFLGSFHPYVIATALKGVELSLKEEILSSIEPWIAKEIRLESDSMGSVSLAEIEESHRGILDNLKEELAEGRLKLWRFR